MEKSNTRLMALFTLLGVLCGFALAVLIQPNPATAQSGPAEQPGGAVNSETGSQTSSAVAAASHAFTYQGLLRQSGTPVTGKCDFQFGLWNALTLGQQIGMTQVILNLQVTNGVFSAQLNGGEEFGPEAFSGQALWIETRVRCPSLTGSYVLLAPRQALTAAPLASGLAPYGILQVDSSSYIRPAFVISASNTAAQDPVGLKVVAGNPAEYFIPHSPVGIVTESYDGVGILAETLDGVGIIAKSTSGTAIYAAADSSGFAGIFTGRVTVDQLVLNGSIVSNKFWVDRLLSFKGPLPLVSADFYTGGGDLMFTFSGSAFSDTPFNMLELNLSLDDVVIGITSIFANNALMHLPFITGQVVVRDVKPGVHYVILSAAPGTVTDANDWFFVSAVNIPK